MWDITVDLIREAYTRPCINSAAIKKFLQNSQTKTFSKENIARQTSHNQGN